MPILTLDIEKPVVGGRMLARHQGQVILVADAVPGERVTARIQRRERGVSFADVVEVLSASPDRRPVVCDARCGGNVLAHIEYGRQLQIKGEIIRDALARIGRISLSTPPPVAGSPERGYRMRARLHVRNGRIGFFREGTNEICDAAATGQLLSATSAWVLGLQRALEAQQLHDVTAIEVTENIPGTERACHVALRAGSALERYRPLAAGLVGLSALAADRARAVTLAGEPAVTDVIRVGGDGATLTLTRDVRSFFQGNRFLLEQVVRRVAGLVPPGAIVDLYAGVGLFALSLAAAGCDPVTAVEGNPTSGADLARNAAPYGRRVRAIHRSVEGFLASASARDVGAATLILDPPRTGLSKDAAEHVVRLRPPRIVYVSCDVATFARDARALVGAGYALADVSGIDLFPNTAHVETIAVLER